MFHKLHLLSQDVPEGGDGFRWRAHPYLRMAGAVPKGPAVFEWSARQRTDLEALWRDPTSEGARERLSRDLAAFCDRLGWSPDAELLADAEKRGEEYMLTFTAVPPELYLLPWEVIQVGAAGTYLSDYASAQVRYAMPGLESRPIQGAPAVPGVLFAWSGAGGAVPREEQAAAIRAAAEAGGAAFRELADVDEVSLRAALEAGPPSVLHLLCHGLPGAEGEPSRLSWGAVDNPSEITATRLARLLRPHAGAIRLVLLSTCGSGDGHDNPMLMGSVAQELHKKGIPSVVASRYPLSVNGSCAMTRTLYDKLLREAWSLERALRHTREALLRVAADGEAHPGDAYGIQLYAYDSERFVSDNAVEAERPVLASYPFGTAARPVPASGPPTAELMLRMDADPSLSEDELVTALRRVSEDERLTVAIPLHNGGAGHALSVHTTVDGAQRLHGAWRSKALQAAIGAIVAEIMTSAVTPAVKSLLASAVGKAGAAAARAGTPTSQVGTAGKAAMTAGKAGAAAGKAGAAAGQVGAAAGQVGAAAGQVAAVGAGKLTTVLAIAGKVVTTKLAIIAVAGTVAVAGGAVAYRAQRQPAADVAAAMTREEADPAGRRAEPSPALGSDRLLAAADPAPTTAEPAEVAPGSAPEAPAPPPTAPRSRPATPPTAPAQQAALASAVEAHPAPAPALEAPQGAAPEMQPVTRPDSQPASPPEPQPATPAPQPASPPEPQPAPAAPPPAAAAPQPAAAAPVHAVCGDAVVEPGEQCDDGNTRPGDGCSPTCTPEAAIKQPVPIDPSILANRRVAGETDVQPSKQTRALMLRDGVTTLRATLRLCVDAAGAVTESTLTARTGYTEYDSKLVEAVRPWRYRPYTVNGTAVSVCSTVEFIYTPQ